MSRRAGPFDPLTLAEAVAVPRAPGVAAEDLHPVGGDLVLQVREFLLIIRQLRKAQNDPCV